MVISVYKAAKYSFLCEMVNPVHESSGFSVINSWQLTNLVFMFGKTSIQHVIDNVMWKYNFATK